ncbi:MAG TPA: 7TM-DISM domain-containing protein, partial [Candidatus Kapabacteria bacterium]|nr:7TM-DISM domain-containing protein [Candidatus Kapabacteria bacterium]
MTRNFLRWLLLWPLLVLSALVKADVVALDPSMQGMPLGRFLEYQVDTGGKASLEQIRARPDWLPLAVDVPNFGLAMPAHWFRLELQVADPGRPWLLEIGYSEVDKLDFYLLDESGRLLDQRELGARRPRAEGSVLHLRPVIPLRLQQPGV